MNQLEKMKSKITVKNIISYVQGNIRYRLYYSRFRFLIREHIREQYEYRIRVMKKECYESGNCVICGCKTTNLQFANKPCDGNCYPRMMSKKEWNKSFLRYEL